MIDRIRQDIQERLDQLLAEAERLRQALSALGGDRAASASGRGSRSSASGSRSRSRSSSSSSSSSSGAPARTRSSAGGARGGRPRSTTGSTRTASTRGRASSGGTKNAVLKALGEAHGEALTASEVAAATGLGRASVSTTLSKLARAGDVTKAQRGYQLADGTAAAASAGTAEDAVAEATSTEA